MTITSARPTWTRELDSARGTVREVARAIRPEFGKRAITTSRGLHDVQLHADLLAHDIISARLKSEYPGYGLVTEEDPGIPWPEADKMWVVDPLDGTNNFGYGIAHCAVALTLFSADRVVLAIIFDPILGREYYATEVAHSGFSVPATTPLGRATVSVVTDYSEDGRVRGQDVSSKIGSRSKRVVSLWSPAMDLALVASGGLDGMVCYRGSLLEVCGGLYVLQSAGGHVIGFDGEPLDIRRDMYQEPISFIAASTEVQAQEILDAL
jgi:myo-inositol-1(or 4)-monophosphatase